jgi:uncharacterized protein DUF6174
MAKNHRWIWYFVVLAGLAVLAMASLVVYNLNQQLTSEQIAAARKLWNEKGPKSYQLTYRIKIGIDKEPDIYVVRVRNGEVVSSTLNERPEEKRLLADRGMDAMFDWIERFQELKAKPNQPQTYIRALFDPKTGAVRWYVRRVMGGSERLEITVEPVEPLESN